MENTATLTALIKEFLRPIVEELVANIDMSDAVTNATVEYLDANLKDACREIVNDAEITISV